MDPMIIPFAAAFSASAFVTYSGLKKGIETSFLVGAAIGVFIVTASITHTVVFFSFDEILKMLYIGAYPAGFFACCALFGEETIRQKLDSAWRIFLAVMLVWLVVVGFIAGGDGDYDDCYDAGPQGMYKVCD